MFVEGLAERAKAVDRSSSLDSEADVGFKAVNVVGGATRRFSAIG
jgi:hypothetical protein